MRRHDRLSITGLPEGEGHALPQVREVLRWKGIESNEIDGLDTDGLPFCYRQRHVDRILLTIQPDVEADNAGVRISTIGVEGFDSTQIGIETRTIEYVS
jgi:hypothetical protein